MNHKNKKFTPILIIFFISLIFSLAVSSIALLKYTDEKIIDKLIANSAKDAPEPNLINKVKIIAIDEDSIMKMGRWPWPRSVLADIVNKLKEAKPAVIGLDIILDIPEKIPGLKYNGIDISETISRQQDLFLIDSLSNCDTVILPMYINKNNSSNYPLEEFYNNNLNRIGFVDFKYNLKIDDVLRNANMVIQPEDQKHYSFAVKLVNKYLNTPDINETLEFLKLKNLKIPKQFRINYSKYNKNIFPANYILNDSIWIPLKKSFENSIVLIGATDELLKDNYLTPLAKKMSGVEIHRQIIYNILSNKYIVELPYIYRIIIICALIVIIILLTLRSIKLGIISAFIGIIIYIISLVIIYNSSMIILPIVPVIIGCLSTLIISIIYKYFVADSESRLFRKYISPNLADKLKNIKKGLIPAVEEKDVTILFADIVGFSPFSDNKDCGEVREMLSLYFKEMLNIIHKHNGTIDKIMGDGIMAFFGDPIKCSISEQALQAVKAGINMQIKAREIKNNPKFNFFEIRIGIHTGWVKVGNIGIDKFLNYTVIGKNVNIAQRLESEAQPGKILISDAVYKHIKDFVTVEDANGKEIKVKGLKEPIKTYTIVGLIE